MGYLESVNAAMRAGMTLAAIKDLLAQGYSAQQIARGATVKPIT